MAKRCFGIATGGIKIKKEIKKIITFSLGIVIGGISGILYKKKQQEDIIKEVSDLKNRYQSYYGLLLEWFSKKKDNNSISEYFITHNYKKIAIYGMGELGMCLIHELENSDITVSYGIEKNGFSNQNCPIPVKALGDGIGNDVDVIVITPFFAFGDILADLIDYTDCPVVSLEDVVYQDE